MDSRKRASIRIAIWCWLRVEHLAVGIFLLGAGICVSTACAQAYPLGEGYMASPGQQRIRNHSPQVARTAIRHGIQRGTVSAVGR